MTRRKPSKKTKRSKTPTKKTKATTGKSRPSTYQTRVSMPTKTAQRVEIVIAVLAKKVSVTEGARLLGISRVQMQNLRNRAELALAEAMTPSKGGRPPKDRITELEAQLESVRDTRDEALDELTKSSNVIVELMDLTREQMAEIRTLDRQVHGRSRHPRRRRKKKSTDDDSEARIRLARARRLVELGASRSTAARAVSSSRSTLRRWAERKRRNQPLVYRRGPGPKRPPKRTQRRRAEARVRKLNGAIGAPALGRAIGISRRDAAAIKHETLTKMEAERKQAATRVHLTTPGIVRSLDAMHFKTVEGKAYGLFLADGAVPYRTSARLVERYDSAAVEHLLAADFGEHGPPLVLRLDRASCQRTPAVHALLHEWNVLHLHGPPRHPQYYGQLERQNREHRDILGPDLLPCAELSAKLGPACAALNDLWPRRSLGWRTCADLWNERRPLAVDRDALREEVTDRAARIQQASSDHLDHEVAWRFAIEHTLIQRGLLRITPGGEC